MHSLRNMGVELHDETQTNMEMRTSCEASKKSITSGILSISQPNNDPCHPLVRGWTVFLFFELMLLYDWSK